MPGSQPSMNPGRFERLAIAALGAVAHLPDSERLDALEASLHASLMPGSHPKPSKPSKPSKPAALLSRDAKALLRAHLQAEAQAPSPLPPSPLPLARSLRPRIHPPSAPHKP